ncbi:uncharacterized protein LOC101863556 [Aplysia californica]|uniref:Uncharacterized protein LOC101863556 n=1 Tax=Aplysia californica TaxID=6500 RepID=A0ABM0JBG1_APLCA|nr:uncharacterized protein LOC101863556 [Aplysia californica]
MTMKKISIKSIKISSQSRRNDQGSQGEREGEYHHHQHQQLHHNPRPQSLQYQHSPQTQTILDCPVGLQTLDISERPCSNSQSSEPVTAPLYHNNVAGSIVINEEPHQRKRERMGLFRNLRRKFSSLRKSEGAECNGHIEQHPSPNITPNLSNTRLKERSKPRFSSRSSSASQSCDSLNSPLKPYMSPKFNEWHSNTDRRDIEGVKDKPGCLSKDISHFSPASSQREEGVLEKVCSADVTVHPNKDQDKNARSDPCCELADCVEYDPVKEQTKIWSPKVWSLTQELFRLSKFGWYWGPITRNEAEDKLTNQPDGAFLVRDSSDERYLLSLSFRSYGRTLHTRIEHCNGVFSFYAQPDSEGYPSIVDLIEHSMNESQTGIFYYSRSRSPGAPQFPVWLTKPVSRFTQVRSLQYLCRFVIRQYTRYDHIQQLPLPTTLKGWIEENQY